MEIAFSALVEGARLFEGFFIFRALKINGKQGTGCGLFKTLVFTEKKQEEIEKREGGETQSLWYHFPIFL